MVSQEFILSELRDTRQKFLEAASALWPHKPDDVFLGEWSMYDLIAHLIGWDYTLIAGVEDLLAGQLPGFYYAYDADWASYNYQLVRQYGKGSWSELLNAAKQSRQELLSFLETIPEDEFNRETGVRYQNTPLTIARLIHAVGKDEGKHYEQVKAWQAGSVPMKAGKH